ncbi:MAG: hypothetical protein HY547_08165 [Elusimicrobia bacterium]|nr:hypothetical protein [Elusimicrobiota bacterium]
MNRNLTLFFSRLFSDQDEARGSFVVHSFAASITALAVGIFLYSSNYWDPYKAVDMWTVMAKVEPDLFARDSYLQLHLSGSYLRMPRLLAWIIQVVGGPDSAFLAAYIFMLAGIFAAYWAFFYFAHALTDSLSVAWLSTLLFGLDATTYPIGEGHLMPAGIRHPLMLALVLLALAFYGRGYRWRFLASLLFAATVHGNLSLMTFLAVALYELFTALRGSLSWKKFLSLWGLGFLGLCLIYGSALTQKETPNREFVTAALAFIQGHITYSHQGKLPIIFSLLGLAFALPLWLSLKNQVIENPRHVFTVGLAMIVLLLSLGSAIYWDHMYPYAQISIYPKLQPLKAGRLIDFFILVYLAQFGLGMLRNKAIPFAWSALFLAALAGSAALDVGLRFLALVVALGNCSGARTPWRLLAWGAVAMLVVLPWIKPVFYFLARFAGLAGAFIDKPSFDPVVGGCFLVVALLGTLWKSRRHFHSLPAALLVIAAFSWCFNKRGFWPPPSESQKPEQDLAEVCAWIDSYAPKGAMFLIPPLMQPDIFYQIARRSLFLSFATLDAHCYYGEKADSVAGKWQALGFNFQGMRTREMIAEQAALIEKKLTMDQILRLAGRYSIDYFLFPKKLNGNNCPVVHENSTYAICRLSPDPLFMPKLQSQ